MSEKHAMSEAREAQMTPEFRRKKYEDLRMNHAIKASGEVAKEPCVELRNRDHLPKFTILSSYEFEELDCRSEREKNFFKSGFSKVSVGMIAPMVTANLQASATYSQSHGNSTFKTTRHEIHYSVQAAVDLSNDYVTPTTDFILKIKDALAKGSLLERQEELNKVWEDFGYVWSPIVYLGGKQDISSQGSIKTSASKATTANGAGAALSVFPEGSQQVTITGSAAQQNNNGTITASDESIQARQYNIIGGHAAPDGIGSDISGWCKSVRADCGSWVIIKRVDKPVPIYDILEPTLKEKVKAVIEAALALKRISKNSVIRLKNCKTQSFLQWSPQYFTTEKEAFSMVVNTSPVYSGGDESQSVVKWELVPDKDTQDPYIRNNDVVRLCAAPSPKDEPKAKYLHASVGRPAPKTKTPAASEVSLREFTQEEVTDADRWVIERVENRSSYVDADDFGVNSSGYIGREDCVRLRLVAASGHYLASHNESLHNIKVRKTKDAIFPASFKDKTKRSKEVVLFDTRSLPCTEKEDEWDLKAV
ncbi:hypothetical protein BC936DRAFT_147494 [Jimgerdemannia flammicorona]|uniref:Uncharacterized protein n=2 Tax=Jimgerdemannia flammicorona TaxID=994334 RepID=A0A433Q5N5_9FUNG|nr:hypothetical protein BC936DRAFT_147494 [Jimgerdemannia flammicorona]RUS25086.1 hypothetical protein BC938DRAFT_472641 [Jimgerdemannia flammicorona]